MALEETFGPATNSDSAPKIGGGSIGGAIVGGTISKVLSDEKFERDKRLREEEVARLQQRENTAYSRSIADMLRAGYDPRSGQTSPSASPSSSVAPVESPNTAEFVSAGMSAGQQIGTAEQSFFATQRQLDQQQEQNEWTITGNMFSHLRQSIDDDLSLAQNDSQYYHGRYIELKKFVSQEMEIEAKHPNERLTNTRQRMRRRRTNCCLNDTMCPFKFPQETTAEPSIPPKRQWL